MFRLRIRINNIYFDARIHVLQFLYEGPDTTTTSYSIKMVGDMKVIRTSDWLVSLRIVVL